MKNEEVYIHIEGSVMLESLTDSGMVKCFFFLSEQVYTNRMAEVTRTRGFCVACYMICEWSLFIPRCKKPNADRFYYSRYNERYCRLYELHPVNLVLLLYRGYDLSFISQKKRKNHDKPAQCFITDDTYIFIFITCNKCMQPLNRAHLASALFNRT